MKRKHNNNSTSNSCHWSCSMWPIEENPTDHKQNTLLHSRRLLVTSNLQESHTGWGEDLHDASQSPQAPNIALESRLLSALMKSSIRWNGCVMQFVRTTTGSPAKLPWKEKKGGKGETDGKKWEGGCSPFKLKRQLKKKGSVGSSLLSLTRESQGHCSLLLFTFELITFSLASYMAQGETTHTNTHTPTKCIFPLTVERSSLQIKSSWLWCPH